MIRIGIVIPGLAIRAGLRTLLAAEADIEVVADAASIAALRASPRDWDVLLTTDDAFDSELFAGLSSAANPTALIVLGEDASTIAEVLKLPFDGRGFLSPEASIEEISAAIRAADEGLLVATPTLLQPGLELRLSDRGAGPELIEQLTEREMEVLELLARGLSNKQIATRLTISTHTVKFHVSSIYAKLGAGNRTEAVRQGVRRGLISL